MDSALLIINPQVGFNHPSTRDALMRALDISRNFEHIYIAKFTHNKGSQFTKLLDWHRMLSGKEDVKLLSEFLDIDAYIIEHQTYTVLTDAQYKQLMDQNISKLYITGIFTDVCVAKTAMDVFDNGLEPIVISDCCATMHGEDVHNSTIKSLQFVIGNRRVITSSQM